MTVRLTIKPALAIGVCAMAIVTATGAHAQQGAAAAPDKQADDQHSGAAADIVVTGTKREQRLQDVPQSISFVGAKQLNAQNIDNVNGLEKATPSFTTTYGALKVRGPGAQTFSRSSEGSVGVVVDGVALGNASTQAAPMPLFDVSRVEILMGPQGTLFGRNSSAGVINVVTNAPDPSKREMAFHVEAGNRDAYRVQAMVNLPLGDNAALRVSGHDTRFATTTYNLRRYGWDNAKTTGGRARLLVEPASNLTFNLIADYEQFENRGGGWSVTQSTPGSYLTTELAKCGITPGPNNRLNCYSGESYDHSKAYGVPFQADWELGDHTLTSITANRWLDRKGGGDTDNLPVDVLDTNSSTTFIRNFSQEVRLASPSGGTLEYVVGGYYFHGKQDATGLQMGSLRLVPFGLRLGQSFRSLIDSDSLAGFGQATLRLTSALRLIGGVRLERQTVSANTTRAKAPGALAPFATIAPVSGRYEDTSFSYRAGVQYDLTPDVMAYVTYARGYKGAAINDQASSATNPIVVLPEIPKAWEAGLKTTLLNGRLAANIAVFRTDITNYQTQFFDSSTASYIYGNAPSARTQGVELSLLGAISDNFSIQGGVTYLDATYGPGYLVACGPLQTAALGCQSYTVGTTTATATDARGRRIAGVPEWKFVLSGEYKHDVGSDLEGYVQADVVRTTSISYAANYDPLAATGAHSPVGARIGLRTQDGHIGVSLYGRNIFNDVTPFTVTQTPLAQQLGDVNSHISFFGSESIRSYGLAIDVKF